MHSDFKYNLMRMNLLKLGKEQLIHLDNLETFFKDKKIKDVSKAEIKAQLEHLTMEKYLNKESEKEYTLTKSGQKELQAVEKAIQKF